MKKGINITNAGDLTSKGRIRLKGIGDAIGTRYEDVIERVYTDDTHIFQSTTINPPRTKTSSLAFGQGFIFI
jgi:hypothetical protein